MAQAQIFVPVNYEDFVKNVILQVKTENSTLPNQLDFLKSKGRKNLSSADIASVLITEGVQNITATRWVNERMKDLVTAGLINPLNAQGNLFDIEAVIEIYNKGYFNDKKSINL